MKSRQPLVVEVTRGSMVESQHQVMAVITDERGIIVGFWGNTDYLTIPRSSIKFLQAIPFVESGAIETYGLDERMIALACSSHKGEKEHLMLATQWMEKIKVNEAILACGPVYPAHEATSKEMIRKGIPPSRIANNCSGKHLGFITTCLALGENPLNYHKYEHACQVRIRKILSEYMKVPHEKMAWGVDGCGIPTHGVSLSAVSVGMTAFLTSPTSQQRKQTLRRIVDACRRYPILVSGTDDFAAAVTEKTHGRAIIKGGAEGVCTGIMPDKGYAFALKVADGNSRAVNVAAAFILRYFGGLSEKEYQELKNYTNPTVKNTLDEVIGEIRVQRSTAVP